MVVRTVKSAPALAVSVRRRTPAAGRAARSGAAVEHVARAPTRDILSVTVAARWTRVHRIAEFDETSPAVTPYENPGGSAEEVDGHSAPAAASATAEMVHDLRCDTRSLLSRCTDPTRGLPRAARWGIGQ